MRHARRAYEKDRPLPEVEISPWRLFSYLKPYWLRMTIASLALVMATLLGLVFPLAIQRVLDTVLDSGNVEDLNRLTYALVGIFAGQAFFRFIQGYNVTLVGERLSIDLRLQLFRRMTELSLDFYTTRRVGELLSRLSADAGTLRTVLTGNVSTVISQSLTLVGSLAIMTIINWRLMGFIVVITPIMVGLGVVFGQWMRRTSTEQQDALAQSTVVVEETISGIRVVKSFVREPYEIGRYEERNAHIFQIATRLTRIRESFGPIMAFLGFSSLAAFLWFGGREVIAGRLTGGELAAFMIYGAGVGGSIGSFAGLYASIQEAIGATKRIFEVIDTQPTIADAPDATTLPPINGQIDFQDVSFEYDARVPVLHDINLTIQPGEALALVGPSGAGKTTLFNLIPRFYDPTEGRICFDGVDIRTVTQASLREQIGIVPQDTQLFGGSVRENILYGRLDASEDDLIAAAEAANAHEFITELPDGYDTIVGERGIKLSGGQRQRVAIARAILKDPRLLLLDEATSSLDSESEGLVQEALDRLMKGRTTLIIAHRLSTIKAVDRIAVLDKGHLVELDTHEELMAMEDVYSRLYNMQFRETETQVLEASELT